MNDATRTAPAHIAQSATDPLITVAQSSTSRKP